MRCLVVVAAVLASSALAAAHAGAQSAGQAAAETATVLFTEASGAVTPVMADHLVDTVAAAEQDGHAALLIRLDTPGGLVTSMRQIVRTFLNADVPVIVWVAPPGAGAASAGYVIASAAHVAAMAPGTNIGAATPIDLEGGEVLDKVVNDAVSYARALAELRGRNAEFAEQAVREGRSVAAEEAVELGVVDLLASTRPELLDLSDGREVLLGEDRSVTLRTANAEAVTYDISVVRRLLQTVADPNIAFLLMSLGTLAIIYELAQPGVGGAGIVGVISILLGLFALSVLPTNLVGAALLVLAVALFIAELFVSGVGVLAGGGAVSLLLAGLFLFQRPTGIGVDLAVLAPTAVLSGLAAAGLAVLAARSRRRPAVSGTAALVGAIGQVRRVDGSGAQVFVDGAWWSARSTGAPLTPGARVRVVGRRDLELIVEPEEEAS
ncbi:MAG: ATP-dependent Clp protease proteolytic subunit [Actinomycetota bacterium]|nr:ATP-dependent Clp protease proteolytic subunit [Actinomycetota bacterium]